MRYGGLLRQLRDSIGRRRDPLDGVFQIARGKLVLCVVAGND